LRWKFSESVTAVTLVLALYVAAISPNVAPQPSERIASDLTAEVVHTLIQNRAPMPSQNVQENITSGIQDVFDEAYGVDLLFNNFYFLILTGIIVVTGHYFLGELRFREFALRYELDRNRNELEESNRKLVELDRLKNRFFANISHELRTPLTLLLAPLESLLHKKDSNADPRQNELLMTMHANAMRLLKLINDLLDLVRMESDQMEVRREPVDLPQMINGLVVSSRQVAENKSIHLRTSVESDVGVVLVDADKVEKTLLNLIFNAIKFTPNGGRVEVRASRHGKEVLLEVEDTGVGIASKQLPYVFDRFWQADGSSKRKHQGAGIGLALVKELTEVQDGRVEVLSQEGRGTLFRVYLPYREGKFDSVSGSAESDAGPATFESDARHTVASEGWLANLYRRAELFPARAQPVRTDAEESAQAGDQSHPLLVIADDEPDMLRFLRSQLNSHYRIVEAENGQAAQDQVFANTPDAVLLDMMMPEKDGLQVCRELREDERTKYLPIILLTARADEETKLMSLAAGASDFLAKPFSSTELHVRIRNLVNSYRLQRELARQNQLLEETIDELKETETLLVQTEKLASLGRMSAGIIHEINNPLNFAATGLYALRNKRKHIMQEQRQDFVDILADVEEGIGRVRDIVSDLRSFASRDSSMKEEVVLQPVVATALRFLSREFESRIAVVAEVPDELKVIANRNKLVQVFVNLLQNAADALETKEFETENEEATIRIEAVREEPQVRITVTDNGPGMNDEVVRQVFDPFFTTKEVGQGMGLGLSVCYRIMQEMGGKIEVRSEPGEWTEFALILSEKELSETDPAQLEVETRTD